MNGHEYARGEGDNDYFQDDKAVFRELAMDNEDKLELQVTGEDDKLIHWV